jgi:type I restriction enzyme, R subunit
MSQLLDDLIKQKRDDTESYEAFLKKAEELVQRMGKGHSDAGIPSALHGNPEATSVYRNLPERLFEPNPPVAGAVQGAETSYGDDRLALTMKIDRAIREKAPADWKGDETRERELLNALFPLLNRDRKATEAIFDIIKKQPNY